MKKTLTYIYFIEQKSKGPGNGGQYDTFLASYVNTETI